MANGILKVGEITTSTGSGNITIGSGVTLKSNVPAFEAFLSADQTSLSDATDVKLQADTEVFDTDNCYDNSTNFRFTPNKAGKYFVYSNIIARADSANDTVWTNNQIFKNGSLYKLIRARPSGGNNANDLAVYVSAVIDMNGTTDYVEIYGNVNTASGGVWYFRDILDARGNYFGAYRIGA